MWFSLFDPLHKNWFLVVKGGELDGEPQLIEFLMNNLRDMSNCGRFHLDFGFSLDRQCRGSRAHFKKTSTRFCNLLNVLVFHMLKERF